MNDDFSYEYAMDCVVVFVCQVNGLDWIRADIITKSESKVYLPTV